MAAAGGAHLPPAGGPPPDPAFAPKRWLAPALAAAGGLLAGVVVVAALLVALAEPTPSDDDAFGEPLGLLSSSSDIGAQVESGAQSVVVVDVAGAVAQPGLHRLEPGARVGDAIKAAGGFAPRADLDAASVSLNLAAPLEDGSKVLVPTLGDERPSTEARAAAGLIDLNRADQAELESLPGIGPVTARKIIDARTERRFEAVRDLRSRGIVGESVFADIKSRVGVG